MRKRYVLRNKRGFFVFVLFILMSLTAVISATSTYGYQEPSYKIITVRRGDTLWNIAEDYNKRGDIRKYIYDIMDLNNLEGCQIIEGMELKVVIE